MSVPDMWNFTTMEDYYRLQTDPHLDDYTRLSLRTGLLASEIKAEVQDSPKGEIDLDLIFEDCAKFREDVDEYCTTIGLPAPASDNPILGPFIYSIYNLGLYFGGAFRVRSLFRERFLAHELDIKDYYRRESAEGSRVLNNLASMMYYLTYDWSPSVGFEMIMTNHRTMDSYHVLSLN